VFDVVNTEGYDKVSMIMDQILYNTTILSHNNDQIGMEHLLEKDMETVVRCFMSSRKILLTRYKGDGDLI
jgi:hypothetical protein